MIRIFFNDKHLNEAWWEDDRFLNVVFSTNKACNGIFERSVLTGNVRQLVGTCQFSLRGITQKSARAKIRRWMKGFFIE